MTPTEIRFAADGMLQSLGTWLRLLGYDCAGGADCFGRKLLEVAGAEDRIFLTRNFHLHEYFPHSLLAGAQILYVLNETLPAQLREVTTKFDLDAERFVFSRCIECNQPLRPIERAAAVNRVPPKVGAQHNAFWQCPHCARIFWQGSHVQNSVRRLQTWLAGANLGRDNPAGEV